MFDDLERSIRSALDETEWALAEVEDTEEDDELHDVWNEVAEAKDCLKNALAELKKVKAQA